MPDLRGRSAREAAIAAARRGPRRGAARLGPRRRPEPRAGRGDRARQHLRADPGPRGGAAVRLQDLLARLPGGGAARRPRARDRGRRPTTRAASAPGLALRGRSAASSPTATSSSRRRGRRARSPSAPRSRPPARGRGCASRTRARRSPRSPRRSSATPRARSTSSASPARTARRPPPTSSTRPCARPGETVGLVGTVEYRVGDRIAEAVRTTPESSDLQALFREMVDAGCRRAVLEVSSHSLALRARPRPRVPGRRLHEPDPRPPRLPRRHGRATSRPSGILFERLLRADGHADRQPRRRPRRRARPREPRARSGPTRSRTRRRTSSPRTCASPSTARASGRARPPGALEIETPLARPLQRPERARRPRRGARPRPAPGRGAARDRRPRAACPAAWSACRPGQDFTVLVDYAHTDDALKNLLETVRELRPRRVDHRLRLRGRPRPHQAPADGRGGRAALRRRHPHLRQPAQRAARGDPRGDPPRDPGRAGRATRSSCPTAATPSPARSRWAARGTWW